MKNSLRFAALTGVLALVVSTASCTSPRDAAENSGGGSGGSSLNLAVYAEEPTSYDPAQAGTGTSGYYQALYDTLIKREDDGSYSPMLATEWTYDESATVLTLTLRDDVTFTDGTSMDADVVVSDLTHFQTAGGSDSTQLSSVTSVVAQDPTTVVITLSQPDPTLVYSLSNSAGFIGSAQAVADGSIAATPAGSGPYTLDTADTTVGAQYTFVRKDDYWGDELPFETIVLHPIQDTSARINALRSGQVDAALLSNASSGQEAAKAGFTHITSEVDFHGLTLFDRAGTQVPALGDVRVRQAINYAIDRDLLVEQGLLGEGTTTSQIWGQGSLGFEDELESHYAFDPGEARALMAEAGYANGFELTMPTVSIFDPTVLTLTQQMLADIGIRVTYVDVPIADLFGQLRGGTYASTFMQFGAGTDWDMVRDYVGPDANWNPFHSTDPQLEPLIAEFPTADEDRKAEIARQMNEVVVDQAWFAPFYRAVQQLYVDDSVTVEPQVGEPGPSLYSWAPAS